MYSQIFLLARRYHSPNSPEHRSRDQCIRELVYVRELTAVLLFPHPSPKGGIHFAAQRPRRQPASAVRLLRLSLPYSSNLEPAPRPLPPLRLTAINHLDPAILFFFLDSRFSILVSGRVDDRSRLLVTTRVPRSVPPPRSSRHP